MPDRRSVDDLSIEELEQILILKKRQARMDRLRHLERDGRRKAGLSPVEEALEEQAADESAALPYESFLYDQSGRLWRHRTTRDKLLLAVEMLAVIGLVAILGYAAYAIQGINRDAASAQAAQVADLPTATATPLIRAVVLPGGHKPPTDPGGAQPNYDEVPAHLRPLVEQQFSGPVIEPTPSSSNAIRIRIPAINIDSVIVQGDGWEQLKMGVAQHLGTGDPGEPGNIVLSAHNDIYGELFRHLDQIQIGDEILISTQTQTFTYRMSYYQIVEPTEVSVMDPTTEPIVTLISCYPYLINTERYVVVAELADS